MIPIDELDPANMPDIDSIFTIEEIKKVELVWGVKWEDLGLIAKLSFGFTARNVLSTDAIVDRIINGPKKDDSNESH